MNISTVAMDQFLINFYNDVVEPMVPEYFKSMEYVPWIFSMLGSAIIGMAGILPLIIIPEDMVMDEKKLKENDPTDSNTLKILLSFAVGGLLGDVFLHLLPEAWAGDASTGSSHDHPSLRSGMWVLAGILIFTIVEKIFSGYVNADEENPQPKCVNIANCLLRRSGAKVPDGATCGNGACEIEDLPGAVRCFGEGKPAKEPTRKVAGYLNLVANSIDNFTHGLAVAGSFLVSFRHGVLATFAILLHEIPHEVGDFAILLRSGFSRWDAAKAQLLTAGAGLLGAVVAIGGSGVTSALDARVSWITPFTAGGFLHISLVTVLPDLLQEECPKQSLKQLAAIVAGILVMAALTIMLEHH